MVISADFEKQKQYFDQENIASLIMLYLFIACENRPSDDGLKKVFIVYDVFYCSIFVSCNCGN